MQISELMNQPAGPITGIFRVSSPRQMVSRIGTSYLTLDLADSSGVIRAFGWPERYLGPAAPPEMSVVRVSGTISTFHDRKQIDLHRLEPVSSVPEPAKLLPWNHCPVIGGIERLNSLLDQITVPSLRTFVDMVLANDDLALPFLVRPASYKQHHSFPGGLLSHCLECAEIIANLELDLPRQTRDLGIVAALWHDIGKVRTLDPSPGAWFLKNAIPHDPLTLELLAPALAVLDKEWSEGGAMMRHILTWDKGAYVRRPLQAIAEAVAAADRISSALSAEQLAFAEADDWKKLATWNGSRYLRFGNA